MVPTRSLGSVHITALRKTKKLTQCAMAKWLGVSQSCLSDWEVGRRRPGLQLGTRIAKLTKIPVAKWFEDAPAEQKEAA